MESTRIGALLFTSPAGTFRLTDFPRLPPQATDAVLRMRRSGICGTDMHIAEGRLPLPAGEWIIGHELIGEITALGKAAGVDGLGHPLRKGDTAIACVAIPCGTCASCGRDETASCMSFGVTYMRNPAESPHLFGGFAEALHSPAANLVKLPEGLDVDAVSAFPCGGPTVIRAFTYAGGLERGELVVVQGTGPLGLFAIAWAVAKGCTVVAIGSGSNPARTVLARRRVAAEILDFRKTSREARAARIKALAAELKRGDGADVVIETSGAPDAFPEGVDLVRTRGRYVVPGQYSNRGGVQIQPQTITFRALRIIGSGQYTLGDIASYLQFLQAHPKVVSVFSSCVSAYKLADWQEAFAAATSGQSIKTVFAA
jgi:threonine dehydrogenase-like Zn-dependent dehydrogenase